MKNKKNRITELLWVICGIWIVSDLLFAAASYFLADTAYDRGFVLKTSISAGLAVFILLMIAALEKGYDLLRRNKENILLQQPKEAQAGH